MNDCGQQPDGAAPLTVSVALVGAQKCGTTTLATLLGAHPQLCLATGKEAHLFDDPTVQRDGVDPAGMELLFAHRQPGQLLLDATPSYLFLPGCIEALARHNPNVKVIVILRPASERAVSHHRHERRRAAERWPLVPALLAEPRRLRRDSDPLGPESAHRVGSYLARGRYTAQLRRLRDLVGHVHVTTLDGLLADPAGEMMAIHRFLGIDPLAVESIPHLNAGDGPNRGVAPRVLEVLTRREMAATAALLGWSPAKLRRRHGVAAR